MREQLISYVELLFAAAEDVEDIKQEILQNTLDRYDDLLAQGKSPQSAYTLAISGIGDISELLTNSAASQSATPAASPADSSTTAESKKEKQLKQAVAIGMYICCPIPVIALSNIGSGTLGVVLTFLLIAAATVLMILSGDNKERKTSDCGCGKTRYAGNPMRKTIQKIITTVGLCLYFLISFATGAWYITWLMFPIMAATKQLIYAIMDLQEGQ